MHGGFRNMMICCSVLGAATLVGAAADDPKQLCPPCAAVGRAQRDADKLPPGARQERAWALGEKGVNVPAEFHPINEETKLLGLGATIVQIDTGITDHPLLPVYDATGGVAKSAADDLFGPGQNNKDPLLSGLLRFPGHGTKTASVIAGRPDKGKVFTNLWGVARGARLIPVRATQGVLLFPNKIGELEADVHKVIYALNQAAEGERGRFQGRVDVVSMSLGTWPASPDLCPAVEKAAKAGIIVLAAAGNEVKRTKYPARCPFAIAIAGSTYDQKPWSGSAGSSEVVASAPAEGVWTASVVAGKYCMEASSGTSFAVALVAGIAADWVMERRLRGETFDRQLPFEQFKAALRQSVRAWEGRDAAAWRGKFGPGIVDMTRLKRLANQP